MRNEMTEVTMNLHDLKQETIDIEEVILAYSQKEIEKQLNKEKITQHVQY